jgi:hypothetical protein
MGDDAGRVLAMGAAGKVGGLVTRVSGRVTCLEGRSLQASDFPPNLDSVRPVT